VLFREIVFRKKSFDRCWLILSLAILVAFVAGCNGLNKDEARSILLSSDTDLQKTIYVDMGYLNGRCGLSPSLPKYAVLKKAGLISIADTGTSTEVLTTNKGDTLFKQIGAHVLDSEGFKMQTGQGRCNIHNWAIPIASKEMLDITVTPAGDNDADVIYNWKWKPNEVGDNFTIDSTTYRSLTRHEQESLTDGDIPLDNSFPHATKVHFFHDGSGWHMGKSQ
jgi:hypothetical protein